MANVRYTIGKIVRKEGCWRGEKGSKVQGGARLILHSTNFTAPIKYKYRTAQHTCREMMGSAASCGVPIPICQININHSQSPPAPASAAPSPLFPHLSPFLIDAARGRGVTRRPGAASRHGGSEATISSHRHQSPAATTSTSSEQVSPSHCQHSIASIAYSTLALASY